MRTALIVIGIIATLLAPFAILIGLAALRAGDWLPWIVQMLLVFILGFGWLVPFVWLVNRLPSRKGKRTHP
jgi:hypothetical protein